MQEIQQYVETYFGIKGKDLSSVTDLFVERELKRNDYLIKMNQYSVGLSFIKSGYLRVFAPNGNGEKEITQWICTPGAFASELSTLVFGSPSRFHVQALTDCQLYTISKENYDKIGDLVDGWHELEKLFIAKCFITLENRVFQQLSMTAEEKFMQLFNQAPEIFNQVPLQYLASMMGMTPETLSRIRKKMIS